LLPPSSFCSPVHQFVCDIVRSQTIPSKELVAGGALVPTAPWQALIGRQRGKVCGRFGLNIMVC